MNDMHGLEVDLDLKQSLNVYATCKQLDNLNLIFNIYDNREQVDLTNYNVRLKAMKSDKVPLIQETNCTISSNVVTIAADKQLTTTSGKTLIELQFINKSTKLKKATFNLVLNVVESTLEVSPSISTATYTLLEELENKLDESGAILEQLDKAIKVSSDLKTSITNGNTTNANLQSNISSGNTLNTSLENNITKGNAVNSTLGTTINSGNVLKASLDIANTQAKTNISTIEAMGDVSGLVQNVKVNSDSIKLVNGELSKKANNTESARSTTAKDITGAINELNSNKANKDGKIQTNLNAEMLENLHSSSFAQNFYITNADFNTLTKSGMYRFNTDNVNAPGLDWGQLLVIHGAGDTIAQICFGFSSNIAYMRMGNPPEVGGVGVWTQWKQIATTETKPVTFLNGWYAGFPIDKNYFTNVSISGKTASITAVVTSGVVNVGTIICQLPAPKNRVHVAITRQDTGASTTIYFQEDGSLKVSMGTIIPNIPYVFSFSYELAV